MYLPCYTWRDALATARKQHSTTDTQTAQRWSLALRMLLFVNRRSGKRVFPLEPPVFVSLKKVSNLDLYPNYAS